MVKGIANKSEQKKVKKKENKSARLKESEGKSERKK